MELKKASGSDPPSGSACNASTAGASAVHLHETMSTAFACGDSFTKCLVHCTSKLLVPCMLVTNEPCIITACWIHIEICLNATVLGFWPGSDRFCSCGHIDNDHLRYQDAMLLLGKQLTRGHETYEPHVKMSLSIALVWAQLYFVQRLHVQVFCLAIDDFPLEVYSKTEPQATVAWIRNGIVGIGFKHASIRSVCVVILVEKTTCTSCFVKFNTWPVSHKRLLRLSFHSRICLHDPYWEIIAKWPKPSVKIGHGWLVSIISYSNYLRAFEKSSQSHSWTSMRNSLPATLSLPPRLPDAMVAIQVTASTLTGAMCFQRPFDPLPSKCHSSYPRGPAKSGGEAN